MHQKCHDKLPFSIKSSGRSVLFELTPAAPRPFRLPLIFLYAASPNLLIFAIVSALSYVIKVALNLSERDIFKVMLVGFAASMALVYIARKTVLAYRLKEWVGKRFSDEVTFDIDEFVYRKGAKTRNIMSYRQLGSIEYDANNQQKKLVNLMTALKNSPRRQKKQLFSELRIKLKESRSKRHLRGGTSLHLKNIDGTELIVLDTDRFNLTDVESILGHLHRLAPQALANPDAEEQISTYNEREVVLQNISLTDEEKNIVLGYVTANRLSKAIKYLETTKQLSHRYASILCHRIAKYQ